MNVRYGQMTAGSYCYIGPQGIVHGTTVSTTTCLNFLSLLKFLLCLINLVFVNFTVFLLTLISQQSVSVVATFIVYSSTVPAFSKLLRKILGRFLIFRKDGEF